MAFISAVEDVGRLNILMCYLISMQLLDGNEKMVETPQSPQEIELSHSTELLPHIAFSKLKNQVLYNIAARRRDFPASLRSYDT